MQGYVARNRLDAFFQQRHPARVAVHRFEMMLPRQQESDASIAHDTSVLQPLECCLDVAAGGVADGNLHPDDITPLLNCLLQPRL